MPGLLYADYLVSWEESEEDLKVMVGHFVEVWKIRGLKVNADKSNVIVLNEEKGLGCKVCVDGMRLDHMSELETLGWVLDESDTYEKECRRKVVSGRQVAGDIRSLVNA